MAIEVRFKFRNETKGAIRFDEVDKEGNVIDDPSKFKIGGLYIRKHVFNGSYPKVLVLGIVTES